MLCRGFGGVFFHGCTDYCARIALLQRRQDAFFFRIPILFLFPLDGFCHGWDGTPTVIGDDLPVGAEGMRLHLGNDFCCVILKSGVEGGQQPSCHQIIQGTFILRKLGRVHSNGSGNQCMVVCHLGGIHGSLAYGQLPTRQSPWDKGLICFRQQLHGGNDLRNHVRRKIAAIRPGIGKRLSLFV